MRKEIWLKIKNTEQCKAVQKVCFDNGIFWNTQDKEEYKNFNASYIFIHEHAIKWDSKVNSDHPFEEVNTDLFIATNGSCDLENLYFNKEVRKNITFETVLVTKLNGNIIGEEIMDSDINLVVNDVVKCISLDEDNESSVEVGKEYVVIEIDRVGFPSIRVGEISETGKCIIPIEKSWCNDEQLEFVGRCYCSKGIYHIEKFNNAAEKCQE